MVKAGGPLEALEGTLEVDRGGRENLKIESKRVRCGIRNADVDQSSIGFQGDSVERGTRLEFRSAVWIVACLLLIGAIRTFAATSLGGVRPEPLPLQSLNPHEVSASSTQLTRRGLVIATGGGFDSLQAGYPSVLLDTGGYKMWYFGCDPSYYCQIGYATSGDGRNWTKWGVVLSPSLPAEGGLIAYPEVRKIGNEYRMWYTGFDGNRYRIFYAASGDGLSWTKYGMVLDAGPPGTPDDMGVALPRVVFDGTYHMWYTTASRTPSLILLATSSDGLNWTKRGVALSPGPSGSFDSAGVQTGAVLRVGGSYGMIYTGLSDTSTSRLFFAFSGNGTGWERLGMALNVSPSSENLVAHASFVFRANGSLAVYYVARAGFADLQIYLADGPSPFPNPGGGSEGFWTLAGPAIILIAGGGVAAAAFVLLLGRKPSRGKAR